MHNKQRKMISLLNKTNIKITYKRHTIYNNIYKHNVLPFNKHEQYFTLCTYVFNSR